jgi:inosine-uridine nucleoside N-ribohydrolase
MYRPLHFIRTLLVLFCFAACLCLAAAPVRGAESQAAPKPIPVILTTDIGDDIDDTWALGLLLRSPELAPKLVIGDNGKPQYRAKIIAKFLERAGRTDIPVGIGVANKEQGQGGQAAWVQDYDLKQYPGKVHEDGVQALIDVVLQSNEPVAIIAVGPQPNLAVALEREPKIARRARYVGMQGSVRKGYNGGKDISAEYNVKADVAAAQKVFTAAWPMRITPLDTCGLVQLKGEKYAAVRDSKDPIASAIIENYRLWSGDKKAPDSQSSILFDTVAVYLTFADAFIKLEELGIRVDDKGFTRIAENGKKMSVATEWKDMGAYEDLLVKRVTTPSEKAAAK